MAFTITKTDSEGCEIEFPARYEVCARCAGHGTHLHPSISNHAYSLEEFQDLYDETDRAEYFKPGGMYDVPCEVCGGKRVVLVPDRDTLTPEQTAQLNEIEHKEDCE